MRNRFAPPESTHYVDSTQRSETLLGRFVWPVAAVPLFAGTILGLFELYRAYWRLRSHLFAGQGLVDVTIAIYAIACILAALKISHGRLSGALIWLALAGIPWLLFEVGISQQPPSDLPWLPVVVMAALRVMFMSSLAAVALALRRRHHDRPI